MSQIIPYRDYSGGVFIKPDGELLPVYGKHDRFARNYCSGEIPKNIQDMKSGLYFIYPEILFFNKTQLSEEDYQLYKEWILNKEKVGSLFSDFLVQVLGYDKVEIASRKTITTSSTIPHIRFYNYYLMDWRIDIVNKILYEDNQFVDKNIPPYFDTYRDIKASAELDDIKDSIPLELRKQFFK